MSAIENAIKHFKEKYKDCRCIEVPEWGDAPDKPLKIYVQPITLKQQQEVRKVWREKGEGSACAFIIHLKALDVDGNRIFAGEQLKLFTQADPELVLEVGVKIWNVSRGKDPDYIEGEEGDSLEDIKKN